MNRLRHWLFNFAAAVSLLLCMATIYLWQFRSYSIGEYGTIRQASGEGFAITSSNGKLLLQRQSLLLPPRGRERPGFWAYDTSPPLDLGMLATASSHWMRMTTTRWHFAGFTLMVAVGPFPGDRTRTRPDELRIASLIVPDWSIVTALALLPGIWIFRCLRHRRRAAIGSCHNCGYDLRATPDRCPECGTVMEEEEPRPEEEPPRAERSRCPKTPARLAQRAPIDPNAEYLDAIGFLSS
jgi:hypothetical protein